jgi:hypothetical protein
LDLCCVPNRRAAFNPFLKSTTATAGVLSHRSEGSQSLLLHPQHRSSVLLLPCIDGGSDGEGYRSGSSTSCSSSMHSSSGSSDHIAANKNDEQVNQPTPTATTTAAPATAATAATAATTSIAIAGWEQSPALSCTYDTITIMDLSRDTSSDASHSSRSPVSYYMDRYDQHQHQHHNDAGAGGGVKGLGNSNSNVDSDSDSDTGLMTSMLFCELDDCDCEAVPVWSPPLLPPLLQPSPPKHLQTQPFLLAVPTPASPKMLPTLPHIPPAPPAPPAPLAPPAPPVQVVLSPPHQLSQQQQQLQPQLPPSHTMPFTMLHELHSTTRQRILHSLLQHYPTGTEPTPGPPAPLHALLTCPSAASSIQSMPNCMVPFLVDNSQVPHPACFTYRSKPNTDEWTSLPCVMQTVR